jgi:DNA primase
MIDTLQIKQNSDLLALIPSELKRVASTGGGEYAGPCPFCGGRDRFRVQPHHEGGGRWFCRRCSGDHWHDVIDFLQRRDGLDFVGAVAALGGEAATPPTAAMVRPSVEDLQMWERTAVIADDWQVAAITAVADGCRAISESAGVMRYLQEQRGLSADTIAEAGLGYNPRARSVGGYWLEAGIVIPHLVGADFVCINVRTTKARQDAGRAKYQAMSGSTKGQLYNLNSLAAAHTAVIVEGEFDALLLGQFLPAGWSALATGGATVNAAAAALDLLNVSTVHLCFDNDAAGDAARAAWQDIRPSALELRVPDGFGDVTDYWRGGGDVAAWVTGGGEE